MGSAAIKDYYKMLEVTPAASTEAIKKSYRRLAMRYHPDMNPDNAFSAARFRELQEAYHILSHQRSREKYDEERWLSGQFSSKAAAPVTPGSILADSRKLRRHIDSIDVYRMNHQALQEVVFILLSDPNMGLLAVESDQETRHAIAAELLAAVRHLRYPFLVPVSEKLLLLASGDEALSSRIIAALKAEEERHRWQKARPWVIVVLTMLLCVILFIAGSR